MEYYLHSLDPFVLRFTETLGIRWYGLSYALGFFCGYLLFRYGNAKGRSPLDNSKLETLMIALFLGVMVGGRLGYMLFYNFDQLRANPSSVFHVWEGGMASHGGIIGVGLALWWCAKRFKLPFYAVADQVCAVAPLGLFFGRIANFINGELWGKVSDVSWAVIFPKAPLEAIGPVVWVAELGQYANPRHPSQLYAAVLEGLVVLAWVQWRYWSIPASSSSPSKCGLQRHGVVATEFLIVYALMRIISEQFREPDAALISLGALDVSRGVFFSLLTLGAGIALRWAIRTPTQSKG